MRKSILIRGAESLPALDFGLPLVMPSWLEAPESLAGSRLTETVGAGAGVGSVVGPAGASADGGGAAPSAS